MPESFRIRAVRLIACTIALLIVAPATHAQSGGAGGCQASLRGQGQQPALTGQQGLAALNAQPQLSALQAYLQNNIAQLAAFQQSGQLTDDQIQIVGQQIARLQNTLSRVNSLQTAAASGSGNQASASSRSLAARSALQGLGTRNLGARNLSAAPGRRR